ncbi:MAG: YdiU family protein [Vampirovibrionales bacterium]|nr:YdiU family protein [Vampirovibrionales bacterium]
MPIFLPTPTRYEALGPEAFSTVSITPLTGAQLALNNDALGQQLGLRVSALNSPQWLDICNGQLNHYSPQPIATVYAGHQFGHLVPQLGDGRAIFLGDVVDSANQRWEIQLKGAGPTPYSRRGDGRAVLRSTLREFLASEAVAGLGIPTTRALSLFTSTEPVYREMMEMGASMVRVAPSFLRFGHLEYAYYQGNDVLLKNYLTLAMDICGTAFGETFEDSEAGCVAWLQAVTTHTAQLMAQWQAVGFCHGVMNTDNMSLLGLTLDYGPYGFLDTFDPYHICNHSDHEGRYAYHRQPDVGYWNCAALGQTLAHMLPVETIQEALKVYPQAYLTHYRSLMAGKLGLSSVQEGDDALLETLLKLMAAHKVDYTQFFRRWSYKTADLAKEALAPLFGCESDAWHQWVEAYGDRLANDGNSQLSDEDLKRYTLSRNPAVVLRNHHAQAAITAAQQGDFSVTQALWDVLKNPYATEADASPFASPPPVDTKPLVISCSS